MGPVGRAEGVVRVKIAVTGQFPGELRVVGLLFRVKPQVFEEKYLPGFERRDPALHLRADAVVDEPDRMRRQLAELIGGHLEAFRGILPAFRAPEVRHQNDGGALADGVLYARQRRPDPRVVRHVAVLRKRNVEVHPHEKPAPLQIDVPECFFPQAILPESSARTRRITSKESSSCPPFSWRIPIRCRTTKEP